MKKDGGPAFPSTFYWNEKEMGYRKSSDGGISMRDYFAVAALQALLVNAPRSLPERLPEHNLQLTTFAYRYADQMLAERDKFM